MTPAAVVVLGAGDLARAHARVIVAHPDLHLAAIVERDVARGTDLIDAVVRFYEGERPRLIADLDAALEELDVDIIAIGTDTAESGAAALPGNKTVIGGDPQFSTGRWFPFDATPSTERDGASDAAFAAHLRQYEAVLHALDSRVPGATA